MLGVVLGAESQKQSVLKPSNSLPSKFVFPGWPCQQNLHETNPVEPGGEAFCLLAALRVSGDNFQLIYLAL